MQKYFIAVFFVLVLGYAYYEGRGLLFGPAIAIASQPAMSAEQFVTISGHADRIATLSMNGEPITVTENGAFDEPYLLSPGLNRIVFDASDKYGNESKKIVEIVYTGSTPTPAIAASSTASTSAQTAAAALTEASTTP